MPHVNLKMYAGRSEEEKKLLAAKISESIRSTLGVEDKYITVAIEDVKDDEWADKVYKKEITPNIEKLYKKPGY
ncbi:MAG: 4-oxalocrotonate tautomerase [Proteobacteria bacterium]|nr:MAG: 4-oxalocrotonate tautomerase [Pseudomonadota bacterium]